MRAAHHDPVVRSMRGVRRGGAAGRARVPFLDKSGWRGGAAAVYPQEKVFARMDRSARRLRWSISRSRCSAKSPQRRLFRFRLSNGRRARIAGGRGRDEVILLKPIDEFRCWYPTISSARCWATCPWPRVLGTETAGHDRTVIRPVPQVDLTRYAIDLRSLAHGAASSPVRLPA